MKGSRPLLEPEAQAVSAALLQTSYPSRNNAMFILGHRSGFRISELLSLNVGDVCQNGQIVDHVSVARMHMKKKMEGRTVILHPQAREALRLWVSELTASFGPSNETFLFRSREGGNRPIDRRTAWRILVSAYAKCGLTGKLGTHAMRKTFAKRVYNKLGKDLVRTQKALGHRNVNSTVSYLSFDEGDIDDAVLGS